MRILGVDPGSRLLGFAVVEKFGNRVHVIEHGTIKVFHKEYRNIAPDETTPSRLKEIHQELSKVIEKHRPTAMAVEKVLFAKNAVSALKLGQARGVVLLTGALHDLQIYEYSATQVKSQITGHGRADKDQVAKMLHLLMGNQNFATSDASDALALAITHAMTPVSERSLTKSTARALPRTSSKHSLKNIFAAKLAKKA